MLLRCKSGSRTDMSAPLLVACIGLQPLRYWIIATLSRYWTHRVITLPGAPVVAKGPYRFLRHPTMP
jgi:methyltransferase